MSRVPGSLNTIPCPWPWALCSIVLAQISALFHFLSAFLHPETFILIPRLFFCGGVDQFGHQLLSSCYSINLGSTPSTTHAESGQHSSRIDTSAVLKPVWMKTNYVNLIFARIGHSIIVDDVVHRGISIIA